MHFDADEMAPQADALSAEFALLCATQRVRNAAAAGELTDLLRDVVDASRAYRAARIPGGEEIDFGVLAHALNELELVLRSAE